jgi:LacI family transcriptional regulator
MLMKPNSRATPRLRRRILLAMDLGAAEQRRVGIAQYAHEAGWILDAGLFAFLPLGPYREYLASARFDGILSSIRKSETKLRRVIDQARVPVVDLGQTMLGLKLPRVLPDHRSAGRLAAVHLMDLGLRHLLFYAHAIRHPAALARRDGFRETALARGITSEEVWWDSAKPAPRGRTRIEWLATKLKLSSHPLGVMAGNDIVATDVLDAADRARLRVPEDVAVIGVDNDPVVTELGPVPLTSVDSARARVGYEAAVLLDRLIDGQPPPREPILIEPGGVVVRRSTQMLAVSDPDLVKAVRFIHDHFRSPITVANVAASTFLSQRRLQDRFVAALGHGMNDEIARQRLEFSKYLLTHTTHKISAIANMAGFGDMNRLGKTFKRKLAITPQAYRRSYQSVFERSADELVDRK